MKRLVILLLGAALAACSGTSKPYVLTGRIAHAGADDLLLIGTHFNQMDTVRLAEDGSFTYSRTVGEPAFGFAYLPDRAFYALVFIDGSSSHLEADADTPTEYRVTGDLEAAQAFHLATMQQLSALAEKEYASFAQMDNAFNKLRDSLVRVLESIEPKAFRAPELKSIDETLRNNRIAYHRQLKVRNAAPQSDTDYNRYMEKLSPATSEEAIVYLYWKEDCAGRQAAPSYLNMVQTAYRNDPRIEFVSITVDKERNDWLKKLAADKPQWRQLRNVDFCTLYGISGIPCFLMISPEGKIITVHAPRPSDPDVSSFINQQLAR